MNVILINRSDTTGGAAVAMHRLLHALLHQGVTARMLVVDRQDIDVYAQMMGTDLANRYHFLSERLNVWLHNGFNRERLFQADPATQGVQIWKHPWVKAADVVVLGWVNQGTLSLRGIERLGRMGKPIVWVMHDQWNSTGVCHLACEKFRGACRACPLLGTRGNDLSTRTQRRKAHLYATTPIHFVAVSHWLEQRCRESSIMHDCHISVIPNTIEAALYDPQRLTDEFYDLPAGKVVVAVGAARLDDPFKGLDRLVAVSRHIASNIPSLAARLHLLLYGDMRDTTLLTQLALPYTWIGPTRDLNGVFQHSDVVLSASRHESFGLTLLEGLCCGCTAVTFDNGGQTDIVRHLQNGYVARDGDIADLAQGLQWAAQARLSRQALHDDAAARFNSPVIAQQYITLFNQLISQPPKSR